MKLSEIGAPRTPPTPLGLPQGTTTVSFQNFMSILQRRNALLLRARWAIINNNAIIT